MEKNLPASAGDPGSIPGSGRSPGEGVAPHSSVLVWKIPWTEEPGGLQSVGSQRRVGHALTFRSVSLVVFHYDIVLLKDNKILQAYKCH